MSMEEVSRLLRNYRQLLDEYEQLVRESNSLREHYLKVYREKVEQKRRKYISSISDPVERALVTEILDRTMFTKLCCLFFELGFLRAEKYYLGVLNVAKNMQRVLMDALHVLIAAREAT